MRDNCFTKHVGLDLLLIVLSLFVLVLQNMTL